MEAEPHGTVTNAHLLTAIKSVEKQQDMYRESNNSRVAAIEAEIKPLRNIEYRLMAYIESQMTAIRSEIQPTTQYVSALMRSDTERARWRGRVSNWLFGAGFFALATFILLIVLAVHNW